MVIWLYHNRVTNTSGSVGKTFDDTGLNPRFVVGVLMAIQETIHKPSLWPLCQCIWRGKLAVLLPCYKPAWQWNAIVSCFYLTCVLVDPANSISVSCSCTPVTFVGRSMLSEVATPPTMNHHFHLAYSFFPNSYSTLQHFSYDSIDAEYDAVWAMAYSM